MIELFIQDSRGGELMDYANITTRIQYQTSRRGEPASLTVDFAKGKVDLGFGSQVLFKVDGEAVFVGYLFEVDRSSDQMTLTFFDQLKYLLRENTFVFVDKNLSQIIEEIAARLNLSVGNLDVSAYVFEPKVHEGKKMLDIIESYIDDLMVFNGEMVTFRDNLGQLEVTSPLNLLCTNTIEAGTLVSDFKYKASIADSANTIVLETKPDEEGPRVLKEYTDSSTQEVWGHLVYYMDATQFSEEQAEQLGLMLLEMKNRPKESMTFSFSLGNIEMKAGAAVFCQFPDSGVAGWYLIEKATHTFTAGEHTMELDLWMTGGE